jgi:glycosyltransferase involved in cell wall biosynthesis
MRIVIWNRWYNPHLAPVIRCLAEMEGNEVTLLVKPHFQDIRLDMPWRVPDYGPTRVAPTNVENWMQVADAELRATTPDTLHLISHHKVDPVCRYAWRRCVTENYKFGLYGACPGVYSSGPGKLARKLIYFANRFGRLRKANPILAVGSQSVQFFRSIGYEAERVFPWAYFVDNHVAPPPQQINAPLSLLHLGRLIERKNTRQLVAVCDRLRRANRAFKLTIVGEGPCAEPLRAQVAALGIGHLTEFRPYIPFEKVADELRQHAVLVLPSFSDDWGVVVNEALQSGLAVVVSDNTGSADVIRASGAGIVFRTGDDDALFESLQTLIDDGETVLRMRRLAVEFSPRLSSATGAAYLQQLCRHVLYGEAPPSAPWLESIAEPSELQPLS